MIFTRKISIIFALCSGIAWAQTSRITVELTAPGLKEGMGSLETMIQAQASSFSGNILAMVESTLSKPLFMQGFNGAAITANLLPGQLQADKGVAFAIGSAASIWATSFSQETITQLQAIGVDTDIEAGTCIQPLLLQASVPLNKLVRGLDVGAFVGFMNARGNAIGIRSFSAGAFSSLKLFAPSEGEKMGMFRWQGVSFSLGGGYSSGTLSMTISPGPIYQSIPLDLDGNGPLVPLSTTISIDPTIDAGVKSTVLGGRISASTGIALFKVLNLSVGGGCSLAAGDSGISIEADEEIVIEGYLSGLVLTPGTIAIGGTTANVHAFSISPFLSANLGFRVGAFKIALPMVWNISKGLGVAVLVELRPWN